MTTGANDHIAGFVEEIGVKPTNKRSRASFVVTFPDIDSAQGLMDFLLENTNKVLRHGIIRGHRWTTSAEAVGTDLNDGVRVTVFYTPV